MRFFGHQHAVLDAAGAMTTASPVVPPGLLPLAAMAAVEDDAATTAPLLVEPLEPAAVTPASLLPALDLQSSPWYSPETPTPFRQATRDPETTGAPPQRDH
ncbi:unnamed protein product, partial [Urochloa humidicola]